MQDCNIFSLIQYFQSKHGNRALDADFDMKSYITTKDSDVQRGELTVRPTTLLLSESHDPELSAQGLARSGWVVP